MSPISTSAGCSTANAMARATASGAMAKARHGVANLRACSRAGQLAGVGQVTLYRHFPTRADLLAEVYRADVDALVQTADTLLADHDPLTALRQWFDRVAEYAAVKRGVFAALEVGTGKDLAAHSHGPIGDAVTRLIDAGRAAGTIRPDVDARDVIILIGYLSRLEPAEFDGRARRLLGVILDGLRAPG